MERINKQKSFNFLNKRNKWLGMVDYKTLIVFFIYSLLVVKIISIFPLKMIYKIYIVANLIMPFVIFIFLNLKEECIVDKLIIIIRFLLKRKIYVNMKYYAKLNTKYVENVEKYHIVKSQIK